MRTDRISVILPVYNGAQHVGPALQSVLDQTHPADEVIVVDDGSIDDSAGIVARLAVGSTVPIRVVHQSNQGPAAARNAGLSLATGNLIAFQDADDVWTPDKLARQTSLLQNHMRAQVVIGHAQLVHTPGAGGDAQGDAGQTGLILLLQASIFRRELFALVGGFNPALRIGEDLEWFLQVLEHPVEIVVHQELVVSYRRHAANLSGNLQRSRGQLLIALQRALVRRRHAGDNAERTATLTFVNAPSP